MGKNAFIRSFWGPSSKRKSEQLRLNIQLLKMNMLEPKFVAYVWGKDNNNFLESCGFETRLMSKNPYPFGPPFDHRVGEAVYITAEYLKERIYPNPMHDKKKYVSLRRDIRDNGFKKEFPIIIRSDGLIRDGHHRYYSARDLNVGVWALVDDTKDYSALKLYAMREALGEFDQIVSLDWDVSSLRSVPNDFWTTLHNKGDFLITLRKYERNNRVCWRKEDRRISPCAAFLYCKNKDFLTGIIREFDKFPERSEEQAIGRYIDGLTDGWQGEDFFRAKYDLPYFAYRDASVIKKDLCFLHFSPRITKVTLRRLGPVRRKGGEEEVKKIVGNRLQKRLNTHLRRMENEV